MPHSAMTLLMEKFSDEYNAPRMAITFQTQEALGGILDLNHNNILIHESVSQVIIEEHAVPLHQSQWFLVLKDYKHRFSKNQFCNC